MEQTKKTIDGFTVPMALFDALPVLFFAGSMVLISLRFQSALFLAGALAMACGGLCKVVWKLLLGLKKGDVRLLNKLFVPLMAGGFLLMIAAVLVNLGRIRFAGIWAAMLSFPSVLCFAAGFALLICMIVFSKKFDRRNAADNWKAQCINALAQGMVFLGLLLLWPPII